MYPKNRLKFLLILSVIVLAVSLSVIYAVGSLLAAPNLVDIGDMPNDLNGESVEFVSETGSPLSGWLIKGKREFGGILLMHGVRSNRKQMVDRAIFLNKIGYTILLFDFQAHGESPGDHITFGYIESKDAEAAFTFLQQRLVIKSIGVIGVSLGGASAVLGDVSHRASALVLEAVYPTLRDAVQNRMSIRMGKLGVYLSPLLLWQLEPRLGFAPEQLSPIDALSEITTPVLIIAGTADKHTTLSESKRMFKAIQGEREFWAVKGAGHQDFLKYSPDQYKNKVKQFFDRYL